MNAATILDSAFAGSGDLFVHRGTATLQDSNGIAGSLELAAELAEDATTATVTGAGAVPLSDGQRAPSGLTLTIAGDTYTLTADAVVQDGALSIAITPAATTTYAAAAAVVLAAAVTVDLVALGAQVEASRSAREPGIAREGADHSATVYVLKSRLSGTRQGLREMELKVDAVTTPIHDVVDEDPFWALIAGGGP